MRPPTARGVCAGLGALALAVGLLVGSDALLGALRSGPAPFSEQLRLGAELFRLSLVAGGACLLVLAALPLWRPGPAVARPAAESSPRLVTMGLLAVLGVATGLRLYGLESGLWYDEVLTYVRYMRLPVGDSITTYDSQNQHFIFSLLAYASYQLFGESAWAARLPAALFGIGSIGALYLLARQVTCARQALLAAALLAVSYHHIWYSQTARGYSGLLFWALLSSWLLLRALGERQPRLWLLYGLTAALGVYTHMTMLFVIVGQFVVYLVESLGRGGEARRNPWPGLLLGFGFAGVLTLQAHSLILPQFFGGTLQQESTVEAWKSPLWTLVELAQGLRAGLSGGPVGLIAAVGGALVFTVGLVSYARTRPAVVYLLLVPVGTIAAVTLGLGHHLWPRFFFFAIGFAVLVAVRGVMVLGEWATQFVPRLTARPALAGTALCAGLILASAASVPRAYNPKQDYGGALSFVESSRSAGDVVVTVGLAHFPYERLYKTGWQYVESVAALESLRAEAPRTWVVYTLPDHLEAVHPDLLAYVQRDFQRVRVFPGTLNGGAVYVYQASPQVGSGTNTVNAVAKSGS